MTSERPIFIVGCPRSGTTLLSSMLHAHPRIAIAPETRILLPVYAERRRFADLAREPNRRALAQRMTRSGTRFADLGLDRYDTTEAIVAAPPTLGSALAALWQAFARSRGKARWGDKRPLYSHYVDVVLRLFPDAQIIHVMRDARACVASLRGVPWWNGSVAAAAAIWTLAERELRRNRARLPATAFHTLRYEDLLRTPATVLDELCGFLGERYSPAMLEHTAAARDIVPARKTWHLNTKHRVNPERAGAWRDRLSPDEIALIEHVTGAALRRNGYHLAEASSAPTARAILDYRREHARRVASITRRRARDLLERRRDIGPLASR